MIIPQPPPTIQQTRLFERIAQSDPNLGLLNLANRFIQVANPLADSIIAGPFVKYTLHNRDHIKKVFHIAGYIIADRTLEHLAPIECLLFLYSAYLHDMGMATTEEEFKSYLIDPAYIESIEKWPEMSNAFKRVRLQLSEADESTRPLFEAEIFDLQRAALANYLRPLHATHGRYKSLIHLIKNASGYFDLFEINGQNFEAELMAICESHNLNAAVLGEMISAHEDRFPRAHPIGGFLINTQFIASLLRLSDILDFDHERTPRILFESLGIKHSNLPGAQVSLYEWQKHLSIKAIEILKDEIVISGISNHPIIESGIKEFCQIIEHEIHDTYAILRRNTNEIQENYQIVLPLVVRANIRSEGYVYMDLVLKLDESAIMTLLMGNRLYTSPLVAVRELVQNGVDSCLVRNSLLGDSSYKPLVSVTVEQNKASSSYWLVVKDNGIGMDEYVLKYHFFRVGSSYYNSPEYKRLYRDKSALQPPITSKFGIGFLSSFMIGNEIEIATRKAYPGGGQSRGNRIFVEGMGSLAFVQEDDAIEAGTVIKIKIKDTDLANAPDIIDQFIRENILRPFVPIEVHMDKMSKIVRSDHYYNVKVLSKSEINTFNLELIELKIERATGMEGKVFMVLFKIGEGQLSFKSGEKFLEITTGTPASRRVKVNPNSIIPEFEGNRITVGGFKMSFSNLSKLFKSNRNRVAVIYDVDFTPSEMVDFNVSRTKILDQSHKLRNNLRNEILIRLKSSEFFDKFDAETRSLFSSLSEGDAFSNQKDRLKRFLEKRIQTGEIIIDYDLLDKVENSLPKQEWPKNVHRAVAEKLKISRSAAYNAIASLIVIGRVKNPNEPNENR